MCGNLQHSKLKVSQCVLQNPSLRKTPTLLFSTSFHYNFWFISLSQSFNSNPSSNQLPRKKKFTFYIIMVQNIVWRDWFFPISLCISFNLYLHTHYYTPTTTRETDKTAIAFFLFFKPKPFFIWEWKMMNILFSLTILWKM